MLASSRGFRPLAERLAKTAALCGTLPWGLIHGAGDRVNLYSYRDDLGSGSIDVDYFRHFYRN